MFKKLFKYDFKSTKRIGFPLLIGVGGLTVIGVIAMLVFASSFKALIYMPENADDTLMITTTLSMISAVTFLFGALIGLAVIAIAMEVYCFVDFYKSTVTDEAYLTFTLPVKVKDLIFSKTLCAFLWFTIQSVAITISVGIILGTGVIALGEEYSVLLEDLQSMGFDPNILINNYVGDIVLNYVLNFVYNIVNTLNTILLVFTAIFFVSTVMRKHRVLGAIGGIVIANAIIGGITGIVQTIVGLIAGVIGELAQNPYISGNITTFVMTIIVGGITIALFFGLKYLMEKKLNIE